MCHLLLLPLKFRNDPSGAGFILKVKRPHFASFSNSLGHCELPHLDIELLQSRLASGILEVSLGCKGTQIFCQIAYSLDNSLDISSSTVDNTGTYAMVFNLAILANSTAHAKSRLVTAHAHK